MDFSEKTCILVYRRNAVAEAIRSGKARKIYFDNKHVKDPLFEEAKLLNIPTEVVSPERLSQISNTASHQGMAAVCPAFEELSLRDLIAQAKGVDHPLIVVLDGIEDPHNLGAILRSCDAFRISGIVMKSHGNAPLNSTVANVSTGAIFYVPVATVPNLNQALAELKDAGFWIVASEGSATQSYEDIDYDRNLAIIVGSEGFGISKNVLKNSDYIVKIPMFGHVNSLNASVAAGILVSYARTKQHG